MTAEKNDRPQMEDFTLGRPALVCRWRLADRALPLENRHLRALGGRTVDGTPVSTQLVAWAKQHIEWTLSDGAARYPDGVLMVIVDEEGRAAMSVGPYEPLAVTTTSALAERALHAGSEGARSRGCRSSQASRGRNERSEDTASVACLGRTSVIKTARHARYRPV